MTKNTIIVKIPEWEGEAPEVEMEVPIYTDFVEWPFVDGQAFINVAKDAVNKYYEEDPDYAKFVMDNAEFKIGSSDTVATGSRVVGEITVK